MNESDLTPVTGLESLHAELRALIASSRQRLSATVNAELSQLCWTVGRGLGNCRITDATINLDTLSATGAG